MEKVIPSKSVLQNKNNKTDIAEQYRVREGDPIVIMPDPYTNQDLTMEYFAAERYGIGLVVANGNSGIGRYTIV